MDSNPEAAAKKARDAAEERFKANDIEGAFSKALEAYSLFPSLPGLLHLLAAYDVHISASRATKTKDAATVWHAVLGVDESSDRNAIRKKFKKMCILVHPDKNSSVAADGAFTLVKKAYTFLTPEESGGDKARSFAPPLQRSSPPPPPSGDETWDTPEIQRSTRCPSCRKKVRCCNNISVIFECGECGLRTGTNSKANPAPDSNSFHPAYPS